MLMNSHSNNSRKRFRTKFTQDQKDKMLKFAEKVGWKMQKKDDEFVHEFCNEIGVDRSVLKVWMHNNKNTLAKRENLNNNENINDGVKSFQLPLEDEEHKNNVEIHGLNHNHYQNEGGVVGVTVRANGSSSSS